MERRDNFSDSQATRETCLTQTQPALYYRHQKWKRLFPLLCLLPLLLGASACCTTLSRSRLERKLQSYQSHKMPYMFFHHWIYRGTLDGMHYIDYETHIPLNPFNIFLVPAHYRIPESELKIPRTIPWSRKGGEAIFPGGDIHHVPDIYYRLAGDITTVTEVLANGQIFATREYKVEGDRVIPHGRWVRGERALFAKEICEYRDGELDGKRAMVTWVSIGSGYFGITMGQEWEHGKPAGIWTLVGHTLQLGEVEFKDGLEIRRSQFGSDWKTKKLLLWEWTRGKLTYKAPWVVGSPSWLMDPHFYMDSKYLPETHPEELSLRWLEKNMRRVDTPHASIPIGKSSDLRPVARNR